ncbi:ABC transporter ATP-binding protein [Patescibacteria group bacterium]|nr:ABC transporter ATP-binding protein [Patescibacteria group bacterium]
MDQEKNQKIFLHDVSKTFKIGMNVRNNALTRFINSLTGKERKKAIKVIDSISLTVSAKENLGIIGGNGSGKSTLLRLIAGIYQRDSGVIKTNGRTIYINGFDIGLKKRLSMRDNIFLIGSIMGLNQKEIKKRFNLIVDFTGLSEFIDTKVYQFSYGMIRRLCFSTTIFCLKENNPEILLLDEVFGSGGDFEFQKKAITKMEEFIKQGSLVILVSHDVEIIKKYCHRAILLEKGQIKKEGPPSVVVDFYLKNKK